jgi:hypothetical protein
VRTMGKQLVNFITCGCESETSQSIKHLLFVMFTAQNVSNKLKSHFKFILNFLTTSILSEIVLIEGRIVLKCIKKEIKSYQKRRVIVYHYIKQFVLNMTNNKCFIDCDVSFCHILYYILLTPFTLLCFCVNL